MGEAEAPSWGGAGTEREAGRTIAPRFSPQLPWAGLLSHFLETGPATGGDALRYTPPDRPSGRSTALSETSDHHGQANLPTEQPSPAQAARVPDPDAHARRARHPRAPSREGPHAPVGLAAYERRQGPSHPGRRPGIPHRAGGSVRSARDRVGGLRRRSASGRRGPPESSPAYPPGSVAGARASGRRRVGCCPCREGEYPGRPIQRAGDGGRTGALAREGDLGVNGVRRVLWTLGTPVRVALIGLIHLYRLTLSGWLGGQCRFYPSCSRYAEDAIRLHGATRGSLMSAWRIARCGPFTRGGVDQVSAPRHSDGRYDAVTQSTVRRTP